MAEESAKKRVFSGVQPTGSLTLGNYLGALKRFGEIQDEYDCYYCVVDLHALTILPDPGSLKQQIEDVAYYMVACGIDPKKSTFFIQSDVPCHAELGWIMECTATFGELSRMTQFKEKSEGKETVSGGLFTYPALMASDILLYETDLVPVGDDQKQHVEICRDLAIRLNGKYGPTVKVPEPLIGVFGARIKSLQDPQKKMSKSDPNPTSYISLGDSPDEVMKKFRRAVTDSGREIVYDPEGKPALANLLAIYSLCSGMDMKATEEFFSGKGYAALKDGLAEIVNETLKPIQAKFTELKATGEMLSILREGAIKANSVASATLSKVKRNLGLVNLIDPKDRRLF